jgi:hypothetical protein
MPRFRPSSSDRITTCIGSTQMSEGIPSKGGRPAREGTACHQVLEAALKGGPSPAEMVGRIIVVEDDKIEFDDVMSDGVQLAIDETKARWDPNTTEMRSEQFLSAQPFDTKDPLWGELGGTVDILLLNWATRRITVIDLKTGMLPVAADAPQLKTYSFLALVNFACAGGWKDVETIIIQPRAPYEDERVKTYIHDIVDVYGWGNTMYLAMRAALSPNPPLNPGEKQCRWCPGAKRPCPAMAQRALDVAQTKFKPIGQEMTVVSPMPDLRPMPVLPDPVGMSGADVSMILEREAVYAAWITMVKQHAVDMLQAGIKVPGWGLKSRTGNRKWVDPVAAEETLLTTGVFREELYTEPKLLSPAQVEKVVPSQHKWLVNTLVFRPEGATTLVRVDETDDTVETVKPLFEPITAKHFPALTHQ